MKFFEWIKRQANRNDPIGDLAQDTLRVKDFPISGEEAELRDYFECTMVSDVFDEAWREYSESIKSRSISPRLRFLVFQRDSFKCQLCGATSVHGRLEIDHKIPVALGGSSDESNLWVLCWTCNRGKGTSTLS